MTLADDVTLDELIMAKDDLSGADIKVSVYQHGLYFKTQITSLFLLHPKKLSVESVLLFSVVTSLRDSWMALKYLL